MEGDSGDSDNSSAGIHGVVPPQAEQPGAAAQDQDYEDPEEKFEIEMQLGRGSYGTVHKARVKATGETIAVKIIPLGEQDEIQDIQREIEMLQECDHANVVRYLGSWRGRDALWIGMEYCGGGSVSDLMHASDAPLEEDLIAFIAAEALAGLAYLHSIGKVHRDIKCGNILLTEAGEVKLADFGVAAQLTNTMSKRNTFIGTPHWMAPEVIQESRYDGKVDVWALGISCIEMAEVVPPRWAVHPMRVIFMISREPPPSLADKNKWALTMQDFIAQCLQKDTRVRPTAKQLQGHKWVVQARPGVAATLLPLIRCSREELARASAAVDGEARVRTPAAPTPIQRSSAAASGHFSWRPGPTTTGTVAAGGGGMGGTVVAAHTPTRPALDGLSYVSTPMASVMESEVGSSESGTLVMHGGGTLRGGSGTFRPAAAWGPPGPALPSTPPAAAETFVVSPDGTEGGDYLAALRSAAKDNDGYLAAVNSAAQDGRISPRAAATPVFPPQPSAGSVGGQQAGEAARLMQRLRALYEGGAVVPIPTLRAAQAPALALLNDIRAPYLPANAPRLPMGQGAQVAVAPWECAALLEALAQEGDGTSAGPGSDGQSQVPPTVLARVAGSPGLLNLLRVLAYHRRVAHEEVLPPAAAEQLQATILNYSDTVRSILCL